MPPVATVGGLTPYQRDRRPVRRHPRRRRAVRGLGHVVPGPRRPGPGRPAAPTAIEVENPLAAEESILRPSLLPGLLKALVTNAAHRRPDVALFEIGHVFLPAGPPASRLPDEPEHLAVALAGRDAAEAVRTWRALAAGLRLDDVHLRAAARPGLHPTRTAELVVAARTSSIGAVGEVDPGVLAAHELDGPVGWLQLDLGLLLATPPAARPPTARSAASRRPTSTSPSWSTTPCPRATWSAPCAARPATWSSGSSCSTSTGAKGSTPGARSLAFHLRFSALDHTLTEDELAALRRRCIEAVESQCGGRLRG